MDLKKSVVLSRTFFLLIMAIIFSCGLMMVWSTFMTSHFRNRAVVEELTRNAKTVADETAKLEMGSLTGDSYNLFLRSAPELLKAGIVLDLNKDVTWARVRQPSEKLWSPIELSVAQNLVSQYTYNIEKRETVVFSAQLTPRGETVLFVGVPILTYREGSSRSELLGGAYIFKNLADYDTGTTPLLLSTIAALLLTLGMMAFPTFYFINLMVKPLLRIRDIAKSLSEGDFSHRANEAYKGEFGELAQSINQMSDHLQETISDLETESNRLQQILNGLNEGIIAFTAKKRLSHMNPTFRSFFPDCRNLPVRAKLSEFPIPELRESFREAMESGETQYLTVPMNNRTLFGQVLLLENSEGQLQGVVGLFRDVTEEERLEQTRREYVANVSHELKTPLTAMRCMIEPLLDGLITSDKDLERYYHIIYDETLRMARLIDDMLELSRLQSGRTMIELEPFQVQNMLEILYAKFSSVAREKGIHFALELPESQLPLAFANPDRTEQIIYIFLDNAAKFTPAGGEIVLRAKVEGEKIILSVQDTGKGISPEDQKHIFERFYKADKSRGSTVGTGLGLSIAKEITEQTGESLWVESELGHGSTFCLTLAIFDERHMQPPLPEETNA